MTKMIKDKYHPQADVALVSADGQRVNVHGFLLAVS